MRLLHCSDLHLDASLQSRFGPETASRRRAEILQTFRRMVNWAHDHEVRAILLCGDLFDTEAPSRPALRAVEETILAHSGLLFFYLRGNHDRICPLFADREPPSNLYLFGEEWRSFPLDLTQNPSPNSSGPEICITGAEGDFSDPPALDPGCINILMLHGQLTEGYLPQGAESIPLSSLRGKGIDYLALGHLHTFREISIDERGTAVYSGCLEGRGFDECGEKGFVLLEVAEKTGVLTHQFIPFAERTLYSVSCDVTGLHSTLQISEAIRARLSALAKEEDSGCRKRRRAPAAEEFPDLSEDLVRIRLTGGLEEDCALNLSLLQSEWEPDFFYLEILDQTSPVVHSEDYLYDASLKGEFVRAVCTACGAGEIDGKLQAEVLLCGLRALAGEEF